MRVKTLVDPFRGQEEAVLHDSRPRDSIAVSQLVLLVSLTSFESTSK